MIEFKQIIGRGTRLFDGKDYFTIYDYVDAHNHFQDPEWDGDPEGGDGGEVTPRICTNCNQSPCVCEEPDIDPCDMCGYDPCICEKVTPETARIKLPDGSTRDVKTNMQTSFWSPEGQPISASEFLRLLFGELPKFFMNEEQLREVWSKPDTRKKLLEELEEAGYSEDSFKQLQAMINAQRCDLFDVLSFIAFNKDLVERKTRANRAKLYLDSYDQRQQEFLDFVLEQYVEEGVWELDDQKLPNLLQLKYLSTDDGVRRLGGNLKSIRDNFIDFQRHLYESSAA
jgi:type I restriction enzyme R subunit